MDNYVPGSLLMDASKERAATESGRKNLMLSSEVQLQNKMKAMQFGEELGVKEAKRQEDVKKKAKLIEDTFYQIKYGATPEIQSQALEKYGEYINLDLSSADPNGIIEDMKRVEAAYKESPKAGKTAMQSLNQKYGANPIVKERMTRFQREQALEGGTPAMREQQFMETGKVPTTTGTSSDKLYINKAGDTMFVDVRNREAVKQARLAGYRPQVKGGAGGGAKESRQWSNDARRALVTSMGGTSKMQPDGSFIFNFGPENEQIGNLAMDLLGNYTDLSVNRAAIAAKKEAEKMMRDLPDPEKHKDGTKARDKDTGTIFQLINGEWVFIGKE